MDGCSLCRLLVLSRISSAVLSNCQYLTILGIDPELRALCRSSMAPKWYPRGSTGAGRKLCFLPNGGRVCHPLAIHCLRHRRSRSTHALPSWGTCCHHSLCKCEANLHGM